MYARICDIRFITQVQLGAGERDVYDPICLQFESVSQYPRFSI